MNKILMLTSDPVILDRRIYQQANSLAEDGYEVSIAFTNPDLLLPEDRNPDVKFICTPIFNHQSKAKTGGFRFWKKIKNLGSGCVLGIRIYQYLIAKFYKTAETWRDGLLKYDWQNYSLIVCHDVPLLPAALALRDINVAPKVLLDAHEIFDAQYDAIYSRSSRKYWLDVCLTYEAHCDGITTVTQLIAENMAKRHKLSAVPSVIENSYPYTNNRENELYSLREIYSIEAHHKLVLCMGEMRPGRGLEDLIFAMRHLVSSDISMCFLGHVDPAYEQSLRKIIKKFGLKNVYLGKKVSPNLVVEYARGADLGIVSNRGLGPNNTLGGPNRLYEYIQARLPILSFTHKGIEEVLSRIKVGKTVGWKSSEELAEHIFSMIDEKENKRLELEAAAKKVCWESDYVNYKQIIDDLIKVS